MALVALMALLALVALKYHMDSIQDAGVRNVLTGAWAAFASTGVPLDAVWEPVSVASPFFIQFLNIKQVTHTGCFFHWYPLKVPSTKKLISRGEVRCI